MPNYEAITESWRVILAELESDVERLKTGEPGRLTSADWSPPTIVGPLPDEYAHYVRELIEAQREAIVALEDARRQTSDRLTAVRAASATTATAGAIYLDTEG